jgi:hypothetical protein
MVKKNSYCIFGVYLVTGTKNPDISQEGTFRISKLLFYITTLKDGQCNPDFWGHFIGLTSSPRPAGRQGGPLRLNIYFFGNSDTAFYNVSVVPFITEATGLQYCTPCLNHTTKLTQILWENDMTLFSIFKLLQQLDRFKILFRNFETRFFCSTVDNFKFLLNSLSSLLMEIGETEKLRSDIIKTISGTFRKASSRNLVNVGE